MSVRLSVWLRWTLKSARYNHAMNSRSAGDRSVAIVGGGPAGMALALALRNQGVRAEIFEARSRSAVSQDARVLALSHGSRQILEGLRAWPGDGVTPIKTIHVSHRGGLGRVRIAAADLDVPALGYVVGASELIAKLDSALQQTNIVYSENTKVDAGETAKLLCEHPLIAWAEGAVDCDAARTRDYGQHAVLCTVQTVAPHMNVAWERFTADGPLALLPRGNSYAVVLTCAASDAAAIVNLSDTDFLPLLQRRFGDRHRFTVATPRVSFALGLRWRVNPVSERQVWLGNAAQTLHPVAGQGFNLALRDIAELTRCVADVSDPGSPEILAGYVRGRQLDRRGAIGFTDLLIDSFASDFGPLKQARGAGLLALDLISPLRNFIARRMMFGARSW